MYLVNEREALWGMPVSLGSLDYIIKMANGDWMDAAETTPQRAQMITIGLPERPWNPTWNVAPDYHVWDEIEEAWVVDYEVFNPLLKNVLKLRRDAKIQDEGLAEVELNSEMLGLRTNTRSLEAMARKSILAPVRNDPLHTTNFKFETFTPVDGLDAGYREVDDAFCQQMYLAMDAVNQKHFDAEKFVLDTHLVTPFATIEDAEVAFDDYLANN